MIFRGNDKPLSATNIFQRAGVSTGAPAPTPGLQGVEGLGVAEAYSCSSTVCVGATPAAVEQIKLTQQLINRFGGSAGFSAISVDGKVGEKTAAAFNKIKAWLKTKGEGGDTYFSHQQLTELITAPNSTVVASLTWALKHNPIAAPSGSSGGSAGGSATPPSVSTVPVVPPSVVSAPKKLAPWVYYAAAGLGGFAVLAIAYKLSARPVSTSPAVAGSRRRHG